MANKPSVQTEFPVDRILQFDSTNDVFIWILPKNERFIAAVKQIKGAKWDKKNWTTQLSTLRQSLRLAKGFNFVFADSVSFAISKYQLQLTYVSRSNLVSDEPQQSPTIELSSEFISIRTLPPTDFRSEAMLAELKLIDGRVWDKAEKIWIIPISSIRQVRNWCEIFGINTSLLKELPDFDPVREPTIEFVDGEFEISFPNDRDLREAVGEIPGADHDKERNVWRIHPSAADFVAKFVDEFNGNVDDESRERFKIDRPQSERYAASSALDAELQIPSLDGKPVINPALPLKNYQNAGIRYCLDSLGFEQLPSKFWSRIPGTMNGGVLNADDMGLGKTVQSLAVIELTQMYPAVVVAPASARLNWENEVKQWLPHRSVEISRGNTPSPLNPGVDITIIGWDTLRSSAGALDARAVVFDEIHLAKNKDAQRSEGALLLANEVRSNDGIVLGLSGTPVLNRTAELESILTILGRIDEFGGSTGFKKRYVSDKTNQVELNINLCSTCMLRRTKKQALPQLGDKLYTPIFMEGDPKILEEYRKYKEGLDVDIKALKDGATDEASLMKAFRREKQTFLTKLDKLKWLAAKAKKQQLADFIESEFISTGRKLVVFAHHRDICEWVSDTFADGCIIYGGIGDAKKQEAIHRFQNDSEQLVIACSIEAAGVAINLTAGSHVLFIEQSWNPGKQDQAADRCHRLGQKAEVTVYTALCNGTVDYPLFKRIGEKRELIGEIMDGTKAALNEDQILWQILFDLDSDTPSDLGVVGEPATSDNPSDDSDIPKITIDEYIESQPTPKGRKIDGVFLASGDPYLHFSLDCTEMKLRTLTYRAMEFNEALRTRTPCKKCSPQ
jgi:hypothetical protein